MSESPVVPSQPDALQSQSLDKQGSFFHDAVEQVARGLRNEIGQLAEQAGTTARQQLASDLVTAVGKLDAQRTQVEILTTLLTESQRFASRTAFFLTQPEGVRCWASQGFGAAASTLEGLQLTYDAGRMWQELARGCGVVLLSTEDCLELERRIDAPAASGGAFVPFVVRGQLGGALYADRLAEDGPLAVEALQLLSYVAAQGLETLALRAGVTSPTLRAHSDGGPGIPLWHPTVAEESVAPPSLQPEVGSEELSAVTSPEPADLEPPSVPPEAVEELSEEEKQAASSAVDEPFAGDASADTSFATEAYDSDSFASDSFVSESFVTEDLAAETLAKNAVEEVMAPEYGSEEEEPPVELMEPPELKPGKTDEPQALVTELMTSEAVEPTTATIENDGVGIEDDGVGIEDDGVGIEDDGVGIEDYGAVEESPKDDLDDTASSLWDLEDEDDTAAVTVSDESPEAVGIDLQAAPPVPAPPVSVQPDPMFEDALGQQTVRLDVSALNTSQPTSSEMAPPPQAFQDADEDPTVLISRPQVEPPPTQVRPPEPTPPPGIGFGAAPPATLEPPPAPTNPGSTEVLPPADVSGPGLAFGSPGGRGGVPEGEQALHEEARRLARLLVSEIKLYNEEVIEAGRRDGNVYERLKDDIDRSQQMYDERIDQRIRDKEDYFYQELVQRLAGGDAKLLGI